MRTLTTHMWKEWRDHRAVLLGILAAIPVLTVIGCWAFAMQIGRLDAAASAFVGGATALTVLALSTELWAGESRRDTLAFTRRLPRGLATAWAGKTLFYLVACAATASYAALVLLCVGRAFGGADAAGSVWFAVTAEPLTWLLAAAIAVLGLWILLVSTWVPRGAAAAGAAALLLALVALPGYLLHQAHPTFRPGQGAVEAVAWVLFALPIAITALCAVRGLRFARGSWGAAWRGLAVIGVLAAGGYAYSAQALYQWAHLTPDDPDMRIMNGVLGAGGRFAFVNVIRGTDALGSDWQTDSRRPWSVDLQTGAWAVLGDPGTTVGPGWRLWQTQGAQLTKGLGLLEVRIWREAGPVGHEDTQHLDGTTGAVWKTLPSDVVTADLAQRIATEQKRLSPVRDARGRRLWYSPQDRAIQREREDGSVEAFPLHERWQWPYAYPWGWRSYDGRHAVALDATADDPRTALPWDLPELPVSYLRLSADRYVSARSAKGSIRGWYVGDVRKGTVERAKGLGPQDQVIASLSHERVLVAHADVPSRPSDLRLDRVDLATGERTTIPLPPGVRGPAKFIGTRTYGWEDLHVLRIDLSSRGGGYARIDAEGLTMTGWIPLESPTTEILGAPNEDGLILLVDSRRIERARWGSAEREVLFPRPKAP